MLHLFIGFRWIVLRREKNGRIPFLPYMELDRSSAPAMSSHVTRQSLKDRCVTVSVTTCHPPGVQETAARNALETSKSPDPPHSHSKNTTLTAKRNSHLIHDSPFSTNLFPSKSANLTMFLTQDDLFLVHRQATE